VAETECKRLEREAEAKQLQEKEEEKKRQQKREERRATDTERSRMKKEEEKKHREEQMRKYLIYAIPVCCTIIGFLWGRFLIPASLGIESPTRTALVGIIAGMVLMPFIKEINEK